MTNILNDIKIGVIGGDSRQLVAAEKLAEDGYETAVYGFDEYDGRLETVMRCVSVEDTVRKADYIILPLPYSIDKIHLNTPLSQSEIHLCDIFKLAEPNQIIMGGKLSELIKSADLAGENIPCEFKISAENIRSKNLKLIDYYDREDVAILNAVPTAEGAINIAMQELPTILSNSKVLIIGYGRIGRILAHKLYGLHTEVSVCARKYEDFAWIEAFGYNGVSYEELNERLTKFDVVFNTVPALILGEERLRLLKRGAVVIDLASNPGGVDFNAAKNLGCNVIWALSLPGKYAPVTSGEIIAKTIRIIMRDINSNADITGNNAQKKSWKI